MLVLLDTNSLGDLTHFNTKVNKDITQWLLSLRRANVDVKVPEICDYELRRKLIQLNSLRSINKLDFINKAFGYLPLNTEAFRLASQLWADERKKGFYTASDKSIDGDVLLAAQAIIESKKPENDGRRVVVATKNLKHLTRLTDADNWENLKP